MKQTFTLTAGQLKKIHDRLVDELCAISREEGHTHKEMVVSTLFVLGAILYETGANVDFSKPVAETLAPMLQGYQFAAMQETHH